MIKIVFLPHKIILPKGKIIFVKSGETILDTALSHNINIDHACEKSCACSTCHCIVEKGFSSLSIMEEKEEDLLDKAWGLTEFSRLACQAKIGNENLEIRIPFYSLNYVKEK
ncbi:2Fe-2S ferredoxin [Buchnera aphidicola (Tetraneura ulmi)]|uniref:ISC system 2Fe-2S type ferredoxin n=1 Tax=Buchnera aphidicola TaxID=9 RepID=UPI003463B58E